MWCYEEWEQRSFIWHLGRRSWPINPRNEGGGTPLYNAAGCAAKCMGFGNFSPRNEYLFHRCFPTVPLDPNWKKKHEKKCQDPTKNLHAKICPNAKTEETLKNIPQKFHKTIFTVCFPVSLLVQHSATYFTFYENFTSIMNFPILLTAYLFPHLAFLWSRK